MVWLLSSNRGVKFTTAEIARRAEITYQGAHYLLNRLCRTVPIVREIDGWFIDGE